MPAMCAVRPEAGGMEQADRPVSVAQVSNLCWVIAQVGNLCYGCGIAQDSLLYVDVTLNHVPQQIVAELLVLWLDSWGQPMEYDDAVNSILMHGIGREDVPLDQALIPHGFLGSLRPYTGLREENFLQVMNAIIALAPHLVGKDLFERRLVSGLWELAFAGFSHRNRCCT